jgi:hypothetical protein
VLLASFSLYRKAMKAVRDPAGDITLNFLQNVMYRLDPA